MFSRGNISEKARILKLASTATSHKVINDSGRPESAIGEGREIGRKGEKCTAIDLYAGIGYFVFSYAKSETVARVLGWELNGWSVEGLRRGAGVNGWGVRVVDGPHQADDDDNEKGEEPYSTDGNEKIIVFKEDNIHAPKRIERLRDRLPAVRHVNCGLLPTSRASWAVAVRVLDPVGGGWIHAHENIAVKDIEGTTDEIVDVFTRLVNVNDLDNRADDERESGNHPHAQQQRQWREVRCQHVERVKTYAPGVMHCVVDIYVPPLPSTSSLSHGSGTIRSPPSAPGQENYSTAQNT